MNGRGLICNDKGGHRATRAAKNEQKLKEQTELSRRKKPSKKTRS